MAVAATAAVPEVGRAVGLFSLPETMPQICWEQRKAAIDIAQEWQSEPLKSETRRSIWEDMLLLVKLTRM